jgi:hypothetical protein
LNVDEHKKHKKHKKEKKKKRREMIEKEGEMGSGLVIRKVK